MKKKIIIPIICVIVLCGIVAGIVFSGIIQKPKLSSFSDEALYTVLRIYGLPAPDEKNIKKEDLLDGHLKELVEIINEDPYFHMAISNSVAAEYYEALQNAVYKYYGIKTSDHTEIRKLSSLSDEEIYAILNGHGVIIPDALKDIDIKGLIKGFEEDPDRANPVDYSLLQNLWEDIRRAVKEYYGIE